MSVSPRVHALVVCDHIEASDEANVYTLLGVRTFIEANRFPYTHLLWVYLQATGQPRNALCRIAIARGTPHEGIVNFLEAEITFDGPLDYVISAWRIEDCSFPEEGLYYTQVYFDGKLCGERMLFVVQNGVIGNGQGTA